MLLAAVAGVLMLIVLMSVVVAVLGPVMASAIVVFVGGLCTLVLLHYVTWGWWLGNIIRRDVEAEERLADGQTQAGPSSATDAPE